MYYSLESGDKILSLHSPQVMGILNVTPDSFFSGSRIDSIQALVDKAGQMLNDGAALLDIGGQSTRPGSIPVSAQEELDRVYPAVEAIRTAFPATWISIDTYRASVISGCSKLRFDIVNDISAGEDDKEMLNTVLRGGWIYIAMHKQGTPQTMQENPVYNEPIQEALFTYFLQKTRHIRKFGIKQIILDPGFGFGKTLDQNYQLLNRMKRLHGLDVPILVGLSRKSMIYKLLETTPEGALNGSSVLHLVALQNGANLLRTHDVKEAVETIKLYNKLREV